MSDEKKDEITGTQAIENDVFYYLNTRVRRATGRWAQYVCKEPYVKNHGEVCKEPYVKNHGEGLP